MENSSVIQNTKILQGAMALGFTGLVLLTIGWLQVGKPPVIELPQTGENLDTCFSDDFGGTSLAEKWHIISNESSISASISNHGSTTNVAKIFYERDSFPGLFLYLQPKTLREQPSNETSGEFDFELKLVDLPIITQGRDGAKLTLAFSLPSSDNTRPTNIYSLAVSMIHSGERRVFKIDGNAAGVSASREEEAIPQKIKISRRIQSQSAEQIDMYVVLSNGTTVTLLSHLNTTPPGPGVFNIISEAATTNSNTMTAYFDDVVIACNGYTGPTVTPIVTTEVTPTTGSTIVPTLVPSVTPTGIPTTAHYRAFVTSTRYSADQINGRSGADEICAQVAGFSNVDGIGTNWFALLSDSQSDAKSNYPSGFNPALPIYGLDGDKWADSFDALFANGPQNNLNVNQYARSVIEYEDQASLTNVWTGTTDAGLKGQNLCSDWTTQTANGSGGNIYGEWVEDFSSASCSEQNRIYCIGKDVFEEVPPLPVKCKNMDVDGNGRFAIADLVEFQKIYFAAEENVSCVVEYTSDPCGPQDVNNNKKIDLPDLTYLAEKYLLPTCQDD